MPHNIQKTKKDHILTESMFDQENIDAGQHSYKSKDDCQKKGGSTKRPLETVNHEEPSSQRPKISSFPVQPVKKGKKTTTTKAATKKPNKKNSAPLLKGQKQLTSFFRL